MCVVQIYLGFGFGCSSPGLQPRENREGRVERWVGGCEGSVSCVGFNGLW